MVFRQSIKILSRSFTYLMFSAERLLVFAGGENFLNWNLPYCLRKTFHYMAKPGGQNHPPRWSICLVSGPCWTPPQQYTSLGVRSNRGSNTSRTFEF